MTCGELARELEVTRRTVLRDVDALTQAGLPIIVLRGSQGGVELGFNYRTRLTGLSADEAEALAIILNQPVPALDELSMRPAASRAIAKLVESFPDIVRQNLIAARETFRFSCDAPADIDPRIAAFADAIRKRQIVFVRSQTSKAREVHPRSMECTGSGWVIHDARPGAPLVALSDAGNINISARTFGFADSSKTSEKKNPAR